MSPVWRNGKICWLLGGWTLFGVLTLLLQTRAHARCPKWIVLFVISSVSNWLNLMADIRTVNMQTRPVLHGAPCLSCCLPVHRKQVLWLLVAVRIILLHSAITKHVSIYHQPHYKKTKTTSAHPHTCGRYWSGNRNFHEVLAEEDQLRNVHT